MPPQYREVLCVGGRHDGRRVRADWCVDVVTLPDFVEVPDLDSMGIYSAVVSVEENRISVYEITEFRGGERRFWVAHPPSQSVEATMAMLLQGYRGL